MIQMTKKRPAKRVNKTSSEQPDWLPIDIRLVPNIFHFGKVTGIARVFLLAEIILASIVVVGSVTLAMVTLVSK